jgi:hypothetical protein
MIALFVLKLSAGICMMWWLMPRHNVTDGFFRIQMRVVLGLAVLAALLLSRNGTWNIADIAMQQTVAEATASAENTERSNRREAAPVTRESVRSWQLRVQIGVAVVGYLGSVFWALGRRLPGNLCIHAMTFGSSATVALHSVYGPGDCIWLQLLSDFASSAVCGSVLTAMLLGHWYLTTPTMSTQPLWWFNYAIVAAACLRLVASTTAVITQGLQVSGTTHWMWLTIHWLGTIVVPLVVAALVWRILRYRNTQSATGVLFAGLILVLMGEMSGTLLERDLHIPY